MRRRRSASTPLASSAPLQTGDATAQLPSPALVIEAILVLVAGYVLGKAFSVLAGVGREGGAAADVDA